MGKGKSAVSTNRTTPGTQGTQYIDRIPDSDDHLPEKKEVRDRKHHAVRYKAVFSRTVLNQEHRTLRTQLTDYFAEKGELDAGTYPMINAFASALARNELMSRYLQATFKKYNRDAKEGGNHAGGLEDLNDEEWKRVMSIFELTRSYDYLTLSYASKLLLTPLEKVRHKKEQLQAEDLSSVLSERQKRAESETIELESVDD